MNPLGISILAALGMATQEPGQVIELREAAASCQTCTISYQARDTLGGIDDPASPANTAEAVRLADGRFLVSSRSIGATVAVYGPEGDFQRFIGQEGEGPGEFAVAPSLRTLPGGAVAMLDSRQGRISLFSSDESFLRTIPLNARVGTFAPTPDGGFVINGPRQGANGIEVLHLLSSDGETVESFAKVDPTQLSGWAMARCLAVTDDGRIWSAAAYGGLMEEWSATAELVRTFKITDPDLQRQPPRGRFDFSREVPPAQVVDLALDSAGRIWIYIVIPNPEWTPRKFTALPPPGTIYHTKVLIFDPKQEQLVAARNFDNIVRPLGDGWVFELIETELGNQRVRVGTVRLEGL